MSCVSEKHESCCIIDGINTHRLFHKCCSEQYPLIPIHKKQHFRIITERQDTHSMRIRYLPVPIKHKADGRNIVFEDET
jgi:hypothetical protein